MKTKKSILGLVPLSFVAAYAFVAGTASAAPIGPAAEEPSPTCTCSPPCDSGKNCCKTANGGCGCFPFACP